MRWETELRSAEKSEEWPDPTYEAFELKTEELDFEIEEAKKENTDGGNLSVSDTSQVMSILVLGRWRTNAEALGGRGEENTS